MVRVSKIARLRWRCRRGSKELDCLLQRFLDRGFASLAEGDLRGFERLLDCEDDRLIDWLILGEVPADEELGTLVRKIRHSAHY